MARPGTTAFCFLAVLFTLCTRTQAKSRRFGAIADTLHLPPLTEAEKWGKNFHIVHAGDILGSLAKDPVDDVDKFLRRFRRDVHDSSGIASTAFGLNDSHSMLIVHWAGESSNVIIALGKSSSHASVHTSNVYISRDYGKTFTDITSTVRGSENPTATIDKYYNSDLLNSHYVFTDINLKCVFTTRNYARTFSRHCSLPFRPRVVSLNPHNVNHILAYDPEALDSPVYVSVNFGRTWRLMKDDVKSFFWGVSPWDPIHTVYVEEKRPRGGNIVLRSDQYFAEDNHETVISGVEDFEIQDEYMFATLKQHLLGPHARDGTLQFWVSYKRDHFIAAEFPVQHGHSDYYVADASEGQVMVCAVHNTSDTNLYISNVEGNRFSLSLERVVYFNPRGANKNTWLSYYYNESFADIHKVAGLRGIYIASQLIEKNGSFTVQNQRSLITFDKGGEWELLNSPTELHGRPNTNCTKNQSCSLHLSQEFTRLYPGSQAQPILSRKSAPGLIMASGTVGSSLKNQQDMFVSHDAGYTWYQVMEGNYLFSMADHGGVMLAARQFQPTDSVYYSTDEGETWESYRFETNEPIRIYGILTEPGEKTTVFSVFGSKPERHSWILYQLNVSGLLGPQCTMSSYKDWSLPDTYPDAGCLLGQKLVIKRRANHTRCYNGEDFVRITDLRNCSCTRDDFECDFGFKPSENIFSNGCVRDNDVYNSQVHKIPDPCPPGTTYSYTRGYRQVSGDTCSGGQEHKYAPLRYSCPVRERSEFVLLAGRNRIQALDISTNNVVDLYLLRYADGGGIGAVTFSYAQNRLFWSTTAPPMIRSVSLNVTGNDSAMTLAQGRMREITSLAYDWTGDTLYWTDAGEKTIEVMRSDGRFRKHLIANNSLVTRPSQLVLDPIHGWMYWVESTYGRYNIMRAWMNGDPSSISALSESPLSSARPQGLTLNFMQERLYYSSNNGNRIVMMYTDGSNSSVMQLPSRAVQSPGPIAVYKGDLMWINMLDNKLMVTPVTGDDVVLVRKTFYYTIVDMIVVSHFFQSEQGACSPPTAPCSQLCAPRPHPSDESLHNRTCLCGDQFGFEQHPTGDQRCHCEGTGETIQDDFCTVNTNVTNTCGPDQFMCKSGRCIPSQWRCDRDDDCRDMSDETDCTYYLCATTAFRCPSGKCIPLRWKCDFDNDCGDNKDEENCVYPECTSSQFKCDNGRCIQGAYVCDMDNDCRDGSDERNCSTRYGTSCYSWEFTCDSGECLGASAQCNGRSDCRDGSDEHNCTTSASHCLSYQFQCDNNHCVLSSWVCDGDNDCLDYSDERSCSFTTETSVTTTPSWNRSHCGFEEFHCSSGFCIMMSSICDGDNDCGDWSDEEFCDYTESPSTTRHPSTCRTNQFTCNSGQCIPYYQRCNNQTDCWDNSDELDCYDRTCPSHHFQCYESVPGQTQCVWGSWQCDGEDDCPHGEDERYCNITGSCPVNYFRCVISEGCVPPEKRCDGYFDCTDHTDELDCGLQCETFGSDRETCCQHGCIFLDCHDDYVRSCFSNDTSIGSSCSINHNNLCRNGTVGPRQHHNSASFFHCPSVDRWIPRMLVCNHQDDCQNNADENYCDFSRMSNVRFYSWESTSTKIVLDWYEPFPASSYLVSYFPQNQPDLWTNLTASNTTFNLTNLIPVTTYVIGIYSKEGSTFSYPSRPVEVTTKQGVPSPPRNLTIQVDLEDGTDWVTLTWQQPVHLNSYNVSYTVDVMDTTNDLAHLRTARGPSIRLFLEVQHVYQFEVRAVNSEGLTSDPLIKTFTYELGRIQPLEVTKGTVTENSVQLSWKKRDTAQSYLVTALIPYQGDRRITRNTTDTSFTFTGLCPGQTVILTVEVMIGPDQLSLPSDPITVTTKGTAIPAINNVTLEASGNRKVIISFVKPPNNNNIKKFTVYYIADREPDLQEFFQKAMRQSTTDNTQQISHLNSCERYFFRVGYGPDTCPISQVHVIHTQEDDTGPPKQLKYKFLAKGGTMQVKLTWKAPCDSVVKSLNYMVKAMWPDRPNGQQDILPTASMNVSMSYIWSKVVRGETYRFQVRTTVPNAQYCHPVIVRIPPYPAPEGFTLIEEANSRVMMSWKEPKDRPAGDDFKGYNVTIWRNGQRVETKIIQSTHLDQNVTRGYSYTVTVSLVVKNGPDGTALKYEFPYYLAEPHDNSVVSLSKTNLVAILVPVCLTIVALAVVVMVFVVRHRRLQRSFLAFANSHYNTRSGTTTFSSDLDDDEPMIQGFSDDEPLVLA